MIIDRRYVIDPQEFDLAAGLEDVADIVEQADASRAFPLIGHRENQLVAVDHAEIAAVGIADTDVVLRP